MDGLAAAGGFLLGRKTYENFAAHWPKQPAEDPLAGTFNDLPKYVVSTTLAEPLARQNSTSLRGAVPAQIAALKSRSGKEIQVLGSGELFQTLIGHDLIDEYPAADPSTSAGQRKASVPGDDCADEVAPH